MSIQRRLLPSAGTGARRLQTASGQVRYSLYQVNSAAYPQREL